MAKKKQSKQKPIELLDSQIPILLGACALSFTYISYFANSTILAMFTVMPLFFIYSIYLVFSALFVYKEVEFLEAFGKDATDAIANRRQKAPKLSKTKLIAAAISFIIGIFLCILL